VTATETATRQQRVRRRRRVRPAPGDVRPVRAQRPPRRRVATVVLPASAVVLQWILLVLAGIALWLFVFALGLSQLQQQHNQHTLYATYREQLAKATAPVGGVMREGAAVAMLDAPAAGLHGSVVVEGSTSADLRSGPGHQPGTPLPGQAGVAVIMGRSASYGGPFARITALRPGDVIVVTTGQGIFRYLVEDVREPGDPFPKALSVGGSQLTLVTSQAQGWRSGWAPTHAVFVDAVLDGKTVAGGPGTVIASAADKPMHGETAGLPVLVLWLQVLALTVFGIVWGVVRWGRWQTWLVGVPILAAALWGAANSVWLLLPNLI